MSSCSGFPNVLVTGSSGSIGRTICPFLKSKGFRVRGFDARPGADVSDFVEGRLEDLPAVRRAARGMDAIIHLAACADDSADFLTELIPSNVIGVYHLFEAARLEGVSRVVFASTIQAVDLSLQSEVIGCGERSPTNHYGLVKVWAEDLAEMYSRLYRLSVIVARLGWFVRDRRELEEIRTAPDGESLFLSRRDAQDFFLGCLAMSRIDFAVVYGLSRQTRFDMTPARTLLGFEARDSFPEGALLDGE